MTSGLNNNSTSPVYNYLAVPNPSYIDALNNTAIDEKEEKPPKTFLDNLLNALGGIASNIKPSVNVSSVNLNLESLIPYVVLGIGLFIILKK